MAKRKASISCSDTYAEKPSKCLRTGKRVQSQLAKAQVEFILHTRDNNKPDPWASHSTTTGPLKFAEVAKLYRAEFGGTSQAPAIEKRYRTWKQRYLDEHPEYPRKIVYAPKTSICQPQKPAQKGLSPNRSYTQGTSIPEAQIPVQETRSSVQSFSFDIDPPHQPEWVTFVILDEGLDCAGRVEIPSSHLRASSSEIAETMIYQSVRELELIEMSKSTVERYVQCILPLGQLPDVEFGLVRGFDEDGIVQYHTTASRIRWNFQELAELYRLAVVLRDENVKTLVLDYALVTGSNSTQVRHDVDLSWRNELLQGAIDEAYMRNEGSISPSEMDAETFCVTFHPQHADEAFPCEKPTPDGKNVVAYKDIACRLVQELCQEGAAHLGPGTPAAKVAVAVQDLESALRVAHQNLNATDQGLSPT